jgi:hypothetical protein
MAPSKKKRKKSARPRPTRTAAPRHLDKHPVAEVAFSAIRACIERHAAKLLKYPNVLEVRPGFKFTGGWITDQPAIVVVVAQKLPESKLDDQSVLPKQIDGVPVDIAPATPIQQLRHAAARATRGMPTSLPEPDLWLPGMDQTGPVTRGGKAKSAAGKTAGARNYRKPPKLSLKPVTGPMNLICHSSPDAGWKTLHAFFNKIARDCTIAMYDFTATHVFEGLQTAMKKAGGTLELCYDGKPSSKRAGEMTEAEIVEKLAADKKFQAKIERAGVGNLYPNAYHIKVAVRDGKAFWISSGNWQGSNQPAEDPAKLSVADQRKLLADHNREWHVVVEHPELAKLFQKYIEWDISEAQRIQKRGGALLSVESFPDLVQPSLASELKRAAPKPVKIFPPLVLKAAKFKVQPILTPDNYREHILPLLQSAKKTLYFQNQYIHYGPNGGDLDALVGILVDRIKAGVDVRIILRDGDTREMLEALKNRGFDMNQIKLLKGCHNKGILVDSEIAVVSSQNWSGDGVQFNRDAGLIMYNAKIAKFYQEIFLYDWDSRAHQKAVAELAMPLVAPPKKRGTRALRGLAALPRGATTISWDDFYGD